MYETRARETPLACATRRTGPTTPGAPYDMVTYEDFNGFCRSLPGTTYVMQWGGSHVWKVGGKVFAIGGWNRAGVGVTFKVSEIAFEHLGTRPGLRPAPYMATRGMSWIQHHAASDMSDQELLDYLRAAYDLVVEKLPRAARAALRVG